LILNVLDMKGAAAGLAAGERANDYIGQARNQLSDTRRRSALPAFDREKGFGYGNRYLAGLKSDYCAVAPDDLI
jgi:hypothetical protein